MLSASKTKLLSPISVSVSEMSIKMEFQTKLQEHSNSYTNNSLPIFPQTETFLLDNPLIYTPCFDPNAFAFGDDFSFLECKSFADNINNLNTGVNTMTGGDHDQNHVMIMSSSSSSYGFGDIKQGKFTAAPEEVSGGRGYYKKAHHQYQDRASNAGGSQELRRGYTYSNKARKKSNVVKSQWTMEEDRTLIRLVEQFGIRKWSNIAQMLPGRIGKQCRERWHNHLRPDIKKDTWSEEEDKVLIEAHAEIGNRWAEITKRLPGRTENSIKNHWNATKRRQYSKRKCRSKYPRGSLLQDYIKSLNLDPTKSAAASAAAGGGAAAAVVEVPSSQGQRSLELCQTTDRLVPDNEFNYEVPDLTLESCSIESLLGDGPLVEFQVKKELDLVEMMSQVNNM